MASAFRSLASLFGADDTLPWTDAKLIALCEKEAGEAPGGPGSREQGDALMKLAWALVHSTRAPDVQRGIAILEGQINSRNAAQREVLYLLGVGYYRAGDYARSRRVVEQAIQVAPDSRQAHSLKKMVEDKIQSEGVIGVGIAAIASALLVGGVAAIAASSRKK